MKYFVSILTVVILLMVTSACNQQSTSSAPSTPSTPADPDRYYNKQKGFSIKFPKDWERKEGVMGTEVMALSTQEGPQDSFRENINVIVENTGPLDFQQYVAANWNNMKNFMTDYQKHEEKNVDLNGHQAMFFVYSGKMGQHTMKNIAYILLHNSRGYVITCSAKPDTLSQYRDQFVAIAETFQLD